MSPANNYSQICNCHWFNSWKKKFSLPILIMVLFVKALCLTFISSLPYNQSKSWTQPLLLPSQGLLDHDTTYFCVRILMFQRILLFLAYSLLNEEGQACSTKICICMSMCLCSSFHNCFLTRWLFNIYFDEIIT